MPQTLPTMVVNAYNAAGVAPHGNTTRWIYTVPAGFYAVVEIMLANLMRDAAAAPAGAARAAISYTPSGGAVLNLLDVPTLDATVGVRENLVWGGRLLMGPGDVLNAATSDVSTGGSYRYRVSMKASQHVL